MTAALDISLLNPLIDAIAERVVKKLGGPPAQRLTYTTRKCGPHFPGKSRQWMIRHIKTMPGARKVGRDWVITSEDYEGWAAAMDDSRKRTRALPPANSNDDIEFADACIAAAGYRLLSSRK